MIKKTLESDAIIYIDRWESTSYQNISYIELAT